MPIVDSGEPGVKGRDERKERALDTGLPTPTPPYAIFTAKGHKNRLDKADAVIHGQSVPIFRCGRKRRFNADRHVLNEQRS